MTSDSHTTASGFCLAAQPQRAILAVGGEERAKFLHGIVSNCVTTLPAETANWTALLTPQGKFLHEMFLLPSPDGESFWLEAEASRLADLSARLKRYRLRAKVTLEDGPDLRIFALWHRGEGEVTLGALPAERGRCLRLTLAEGVVASLYADPRLSAAGWRIVVPSGSEALLSAALANLLSQPVNEVKAEDWNHHRLTLGLPEGAADLEVEGSTLLESGFEELSGVDFKKGCYIGQEVTARMRFRGLVKKRLVPVVSAQPLPAVGTILRQADGKDAGEMRSSMVLTDGSGLGLALVRLEALEAPLFAENAPDILLRSVPVAWMVLRDVKKS